MNTTPVYDNSKPAPWFGRVHYADGMGRCMYQAFDQFRTRRAACAYWWMLARKGVVAFLPDENRVGQTNANLKREQEPADLKAAIDQCEREYDKEGEGFDEGVDFHRACSIFHAGRA